MIVCKECGRVVRTYKSAAPPGPPVEVFVAHLVEPGGIFWCAASQQPVPSQLILVGERPARVDVDG